MLCTQMLREVVILCYFERFYCLLELPDRYKTNKMVCYFLSGSVKWNIVTCIDSMYGGKYRFQI